MSTLFIDYHQLDVNKIRDAIYVRDYNGMLIYKPYYSYTDKTKDILQLKTKFINLSIDPFKFMIEGSKKYIFINPNDPSFAHLYKCLQDISRFTTNYVSLLHNDKSKIKEAGPILSNYSSEISNKTQSLNTDVKMKNIKLHFYEKDGQIISTIYNYNKSNKYKQVEQYDRCNLSDIARFVSKGKQVRFILDPMIWYQSSTGRYGTKLYIRCMEVKYADQEIKSMIDKNEVNLNARVTELEI